MSKLFIAHHEGGHGIEDATRFIEKVEERNKNAGEPLLWTTDEWDAYIDALLEVYGKWEEYEYQGIGRPRLPRRVPPDNLMYAQVMKRREEGRVIEVKRKVVFGDLEKIEEILNGKKINTSYVERNNLTMRQHVSRLVRKTLAFSKELRYLTAHLDFYQAWFIFVKPHLSLRVESKVKGRKWDKRTPAMAAGITDHIWTMEELMTFRVANL